MSNSEESEDYLKEVLEVEQNDRAVSTSDGPVTRFKTIYLLG